MKQIYLAPLEGVTDNIYRKTFMTYYGGVSKCYTPFLSPNSHHKFSTREFDEIDPQKNNVANIYTDLMECFVEHGHNVVVVCSSEHRFRRDTHLAEERGMKVLYVRTGNLTKV